MEIILPCLFLCGGTVTTVTCKDGKASDVNGPCDAHGECAPEEVGPLSCSSCWQPDVIGHCGCEGGRPSDVVGREEAGLRMYGQPSGVADAPYLVTTNPIVALIRYGPWL